MSNIDWSQLITKAMKDEVKLAAIRAAKVLAEDTWRVSERLIIDRQLEAIEEDEADETPVDLLPGTRKQWLAYRGKVSNWKEGNVDFPDSNKRPVRPY